MNSFQNFAGNEDDESVVYNEFPVHVHCTMTEKNYLMSSLAMSVRPSVRLSVCPSVRHLWKYLWNAVAV